MVNSQAHLQYKNEAKLVLKAAQFKSITFDYDSVHQNGVTQAKQNEKIGFKASSYARSLVSK
ncbi:hypothetical protein TTHERM_00058340 (macronuclear) [Tetrahymena thermophila SB210]|uniref:Uncharacterized protein n=1 Tax=Tetrahymena thermophila (strain SB210) TaxID=312017 RepID=I7LTU7_TETTS|nr:hypothetical protein TTHERM_00058340 [Tetrahymena thermophila SB210]EAR87322.1 hypothetical protein TTHERM_00058340 [Tetrahymena thermophila SB210]|eukprot:XP_001007567.1 hypothetical protein TTHERM_00058340 [Tetrahymena thermophila SB210]